jgi:cytochrome c-type biogenesis protein CcmH/NrfF
MRASKNNLLILIFAVTLAMTFAAAGFAQSATELESPAVLRVADKMLCSCGCTLTMACKMEGDCHVCRQAKAKIFAMQAAGKSDGEIIDGFVQENGRDVLAVRPGVMGVLGPYLALGIGMILVIFIIRRLSSRKPAPAPAAAAIDSQVFDRYHDRIEKDMAKLE